MSLRRLTSGLFTSLFLTGAFLYAFPSATVSYAIVGLLHVLAAVAGAVGLVVFLWRNRQRLAGLERAGWFVMLAGAVVGLALIYLGTARPEWKWLYLHIAASLAACALLSAHWLSGR